MPEQTIRAVRRVFRFPVLYRLLRYVAGFTLYAALVVRFGGRLDLASEVRPQARVGEVVLFGILFGWLMSFRTQAAYARWWEGRVLWGQLVNDSRNLHLKAVAHVADPIATAKLGAVLARFAEVLRDHLRRPPGSAGPHEPMAAAGEVFALLRRWYAEGLIDGFVLLALDRHARELMNVCGACERIRATPLTASYSGLLRKAITGFLLLLPWLLADLGWWAVLVTALVAYALVSLELIASSIEDPFGHDPDDLPLDDIVATIRRGVTRPE
jgi:putative membrane protein